jgi:type II secretory pathway component PulM
MHEHLRRLAGDLKDHKAKGLERKTRLDEALRDVRSLNLTVAKLQRDLASARAGATGPAQQPATLHADSRTMAQQHIALTDEIDRLKDQNEQLKLEVNNATNVGQVRDWPCVATNHLPTNAMSVEERT